MRRAILVGMLLAGAVQATPRFSGEPEARFTGAVAAPFALVERHRDPHPRFPHEPHHPQGRHVLPAIHQAFGTEEPDSGSFLLHAAPGWDSAPRPVPVLCLPGAFDNATLRYGHPGLLEDESPPRPGLGLYLARRGYAVFALTFAHAQGCNLHQGEQVANAIQRIRALLGREDDPDFRVDLITHSKGLFPARCYLQSAGPAMGLGHLTPYRGDVRRCVFQAGPIAGMDTPYRYYAYPLKAQGRSAFPAMPQPAERVLKWGLWQKASARDSIFSEYWNGTRQVMNDLRPLGIPFGPLSYTPDLGATMRALVDGGTTLLLRSRGLKAAVEAGGNLVALLNRDGLPPEVDASLVAGTHPVLYKRSKLLGWRYPIGAELSGTSDGAVFLKSVFHTQGLTGQGARILGKRSWPLNHVDLTRSEEVYLWVAGQLALP